jgi:hypothetical protein
LLLALIYPDRLWKIQPLPTLILLEVLAMKTLRVIKKALAHLELLLEVDTITPSGDIIYHSGKNEMDAKESLLSAMFVELNGKPGYKNDDNKSEDNDDDEVENTTCDVSNASGNNIRSPDYYFHGGLRFYYLVLSPPRGNDYQSCAVKNTLVIIVRQHPVKHNVTWRKMRRINNVNSKLTKKVILQLED